MRTAPSVAVAFFLVTLLVSRCAGRPWQQRQRQRSPRPAAVAAYRPSTTAAPYAEYDDSPVAADDDRPSGGTALRPPPPEPADYGEPERVYAEPEQNYEVDEAVSVLSDGRVHGVQQQQAPTTTTAPRSAAAAAAAAVAVTAAAAAAAAATDGSTVAAETRKSGYVLDGKHYRKYRVEEETPDGFIVGEYGVVSHHDGTTRGVRYTADSSINPRVIYEALAKFLALRRRR